MDIAAPNKMAKENDGKAARGKVLKQLVAVVFVALAAVAAVKSFGTGSWHAGSPRHEDQQRTPAKPQAAAETGDVAKSDGSSANVVASSGAGAQDRDRDTVRFVFANLDGEEGREGDVIVKLRPEWAPLGVERIRELTDAKFWEGCRAFRVLPNFVVQLGINGDPKVQGEWREKNLVDDPVKAKNERGTLTFATSGKDTRTTQIFINTFNNKHLDKDFAPFGEITSGMDVVDRIYREYRERPNQGSIQMRGNEYLLKEFPKLSYIKSAEFVTSSSGAS